MATQTTEQQNALKDAMERAKQIAAKLQQQHPATVTENKPDQDESRKRNFQDSNTFIGEPYMKKPAIDGAVDHTDPKIIAQQVANSLVQRAGLGSMLVEDITIPNKLVGLVIGRGGEMINKLQSDSGAKIQVAPDPPAEMADMVEDRQITITGTTEAVNKAKKIIEQIRSDGKVPERIVMNANLPGEYSVDVNIASGKVGLVIGKGGETIKALQERADCKMVLFQDGEYQNAAEKPLRISGEQSKVMYGKQLVLDLLTMKELESIVPEKQRPHGEAYDEVQVPRDAVGFVIGAKGASINHIQQVTGCRVQFKNDMEGEFKIATLNGTPQEVTNAKQKLNEILQSHRERRAGGGGRGNWGGPRGPRPQWGTPQGGGFNNGPRPNWGGPGGPRGWSPGHRGGFGGRGRGGHGGGAGPLPPGHKHMEIHVPANKCGLVIGKGGETLKYIHSETNVNIEINREVPDLSPYRVFHLRGSEDMIQQAQEIIQEKIGDSSVTAKPAGEGEPDGGAQGVPNQFGSPQQQNQQWGGQQQDAGGEWNQQQQPQQEQWGQQGGWNQQQVQQQQGGWNQQPASNAPWNQQQPQQQWQQPNANQWQNLHQQPYQWGQQQTSQQPAVNPENPPAAITTPAAQPNSTVSTDPAAQTGAQPDYSAAWAMYYQQQNQYYQQYAVQQQAPTSTAASVPGATSAQTPGTPTSTSQAAAMADYQAKMAEYYKSFGQQPPMQ